MTPEMHQTVNYLLHAYKRTGTKLYRRKQIIGFWRRHDHLSESTKNEY